MIRLCYLGKYLIANFFLGQILWFDLQFLTLQSSFSSILSIMCSTVWVSLPCWKKNNRNHHRNSNSFHKNHYKITFCFGPYSLFYWPSARLHPTNRMHQIPIDTITVYIKTNTFPPLNPLHFLLCFAWFYSFFCVFFPCREDYNVLLLLQNYWISQEIFFYKVLRATLADLFIFKYLGF